MSADLNLLFGVLALQMDFIGRDDLVAGMHAWVLEKSTPLGELLCRGGALTPTRRALIDAVVQEHLQQHQDDPRQALSALPAGPLGPALAQVTDNDVQDSLSSLGTANTTPPDHPYATTPYAPTRRPPGGRFQVLRPHARGGLGEVFVARDEELKREVALKEIQAQHADAAESRARFLLEAEVTGQLEHPGIVPIYGLGHHADGRPYYAMRFVKGESLLEGIQRYHKSEGKSPAGERALALRQLLARFVAVCDAVEYAHSRRVLHRDIKPANIMLGPYGETLVVDWGLAKLFDAPPDGGEGQDTPALLADSSMTQTGRVLGTPAYMSPEQAGGRLRDLGPPSDVYSLGATLYHLLTGRAPFRSGELGEALQRIERGDYPRPREVNWAVPKALEAVCLKAMALRPADRYPSARQLATDVERWLADEPVLAYREPAARRGARWVRRHQRLVTAAAVLLLLALPLAVALAVVSDRSRRQADADRESIAEEQQKAARLAQRRQKVSDFYEKHVLTAARPRGVGLGRDIGLKEALDRASERIAESFAGEPEDEASVCATLGETYMHLGEFAKAEKLLRRAFALQEQALGLADRETLGTASHLIPALYYQNKFAEARALSDRALPAATARHGAENALTLTLRHNAASLVALMGNFKEAADHYRVLVRVRERLFGPTHKDTIDSLHQLGWCLLNLGQLAEAEQALERSVTAAESLLGAGHPSLLERRGQLARALIAQGKLDQGERIIGQILPRMKETFGEDHFSTLIVQGDLVGLLLARDRPAEAERLAASLLPRLKKALPPGHPEILACTSHWALALGMAGHARKAADLLLELLPQLETAHGPDAPPTLTARHNLAAALFVLGDVKQAEPLLEKVAEDRRRVLGPLSRHTLASTHLLGVQWNAQGRFKDAERHFRVVVIPAARQALGPLHPLTLKPCYELAFSLNGQRRFREALPISGLAVRGLENLHGVGHLDTVKALILRGSLLIQLRRFREAEELFPVAIAGLRDRAELRPHLRDCYMNLAYVLFVQKKFPQAEKPLRDAYASAQKDLSGGHKQTQLIAGHLCNVLIRQGKWADVEAPAEALFAATLEAHGAAHPETLTAGLNLAQSLFVQKKHDKALPVLRDLFRPVAGQSPGSPTRLRLAPLLGWALLESGHLDEAEPLLRELLEGRRKRLPTNHWLVGNAESLLGDCLRRRGSYAEAEKLLLSGHASLARGEGAPPRPPDRVDESNARVAALYTARREKAKLEAWLRPAPQP